MKFNLSRFALTIRKEVSDSRRALLTFAVGSVALVFVADIVIIIANGQSRMAVLTDTLGSFNVFFLMVAASFAASTAFRSFCKKAAAASALMLPASEMEKFLCRWLIAVPCALLTLAVAAYAGDFLSSGVAAFIHNIGYRGTFGWNQYITESMDVRMTVMCLLFVQSFFFLGSLLWPRFSWCKSLILLLVTATLVVSVIIGVITSSEISSHRNMALNIIGRDELMVALPVLAVINYIISYFRFREMEIINRW